MDEPYQPTTNNSNNKKSTNQTTSNNQIIYFLEDLRREWRFPDFLAGEALRLAEPERLRRFPPARDGDAERCFLASVRADEVTR